MGGRQARTAPQFGHIFDHFAIDLRISQRRSCSQHVPAIDNTPGRVTETVTGTRGKWTAPNHSGPPVGRRNRYEITGEHAWTFSDRQDNDPYQRAHRPDPEHQGECRPINDLRRVAESTLTAIMGRMSRVQRPARELGRRSTRNWR